MIQDVQEQVEQGFQAKRYYIYAPYNAQSLRQQYRELGDNPTLRDLSATDLLFVWWYANKTSPILELPDKERVVIAVQKAHASKHQAEAKLAQYKNLNFPDSVRAAIKVMGSFDPAGRISAIADDLHLLKQCQSVIRKDVSSADLDEITEWTKAVKAAREMRDDILARLERGSMGVMESTGDTFAHLEGVAAEFVITKTD